MLIFMVRTPKITAKSVLHLIHPSTNKDTTVLDVLKKTKAERKQVIFPGNSFLEKNVFATFETVVINTVSPKHLVDWTHRLKSMTKDLEAVVSNPKRNLIVYGESVRCLAPKLLRIPQTPGILYNSTTVSPEIIHDQEGLNYLPFYVDLCAEAGLRNSAYNRNLRYAASLFKPMYAFSQDVIWTSSGKHSGTIYTVTEEKIAVCETPPSIVNGSTPKELPRMQALYADDFDKDGNRIPKKDEEEGIDGIETEEEE